jgi:hypothetical protein
MGQPSSTSGALARTIETIGSDAPENEATGLNKTIISGADIIREAIIRAHERELRIATAAGYIRDILAEHRLPSINRRLGGLYFDPISIVETPPIMIASGERAPETSASRWIFGLQSTVNAPSVLIEQPLTPHKYGRFQGSPLMIWRDDGLGNEELQYSINPDSGKIRYHELETRRMDELLGVDVTELPEIPGDNTRGMIGFSGRIPESSHVAFREELESWLHGDEHPTQKLTLDQERRAAQLDILLSADREELGRPELPDVEMLRKIVTGGLSYLGRYRTLISKVVLLN